MTEALQKGDEVVTSGGVLGKITKIATPRASIEIRAQYLRCRCKGARSRRSAQGHDQAI